MQNSDRVWDLVETHRPEFVALADRVFDTPELACKRRARASPATSPGSRPR